MTTDGSSYSAGHSIGQGDTYFRLIRHPGTNAGANFFGVVIIDILDYANTNKFKTVKAIGGYDANGSGWPSVNSAVYRETNAVSSIKFSSGGSLAQYSQFALYGVKSA